MMNYNIERKKQNLAKFFFLAFQRTSARKKKKSDDVKKTTKKNGKKCKTSTRGAVDVSSHEERIHAYARFSSSSRWFLLEKKTREEKKRSIIRWYWRT